jgi:hypothetical protein
MRERREFYRIQTFARVSLRVLRPEELDRARLRLRVRHLPTALSPGAIEESRSSSESRALFGLMEHIALTLDRIDRKIDALAHMRESGESDTHVSPGATEIELSGSGFSGPFEIEAPKGTLVEAQIDLGESGGPLINAIARVRAINSRDGEPRVTAFAFEELLPEDLERIVQLSLKKQSKGIRGVTRHE